MPVKYKLFFSSSVHIGLLLGSLGAFVLIPNNVAATIVAGALYVVGLIALPDLPHLKARAAKQAKDAETARINEDFNKLVNETRDLEVEQQVKAYEFVTSCRTMYDEVLVSSSPTTLSHHVGSQLKTLAEQYISLCKDQKKHRDFLRPLSKRDLKARLATVTEKLESSAKDSRLEAINRSTKESLEKQLTYIGLLEDNVFLVNAELIRLQESLTVFLMELKQTRTINGVAGQIDDTLSSLSTTNESIAQIAELTASMPSQTFSRSRVTE